MKKISKGNDTYNKILEVTKKLIRDKGIYNITTRMITGEANVNLALINYHFSTKDDLIITAIKSMIGDIKFIFDILDDEKLEKKVRLRNFLIEFARAAKERAELMNYSISQNQNINCEKEKIITTYLKENGIEKFLKFLGTVIAVDDKEKLLVISTQILSAVSFPNIYAFVAGEENFPSIETQIDTLLEVLNYRD